MPSYLKVESIEINRMRSHYIKMMTLVWKSYARNCIGTSCNILGTFANENLFIPTTELASIVGI